MQIEVNINVRGLDPLVEAISSLASTFGPVEVKGSEGERVIKEVQKATAGKSKGKSQPAATAEPSTEPSETLTTTETTSSEAASADQTSADTASSVGKPSTTKEKAAPSEELPAQQASETTTYSDEDMRRLGSEAAKRNREATVAIVKKYAPSISAVPNDKRAELVELLAQVK